MTSAITLCHDVPALRLKIAELHTAGKYSSYLKLIETEGEASKVIIVGMSSKTAVASPDGLCSGCYMDVAMRDIVGDPEDAEYVPFLEAVGMECLAYGDSQHGVDSPLSKLQQDPIALAKYETIWPPVAITDEDGQPTGELRFQSCTIFARK